MIINIIIIILVFFVFISTGEFNFLTILLFYANKYMTATNRTVTSATADVTSIATFSKNLTENLTSTLFFWPYCCVLPR